MDAIIRLLSSEAAVHLLSLAVRPDLVWCGGWEEKAEEHLPHALDLPPGLAFASFPRDLRQAP